MTTAALHPRRKHISITAVPHFARNRAFAEALTSSSRVPTSFRTYATSDAYASTKKARLKQPGFLI
jgi:hypothetical protein